MTFIEILLAMALLLIAGGTLLMVLSRARTQAAYLGQLQLAQTAVRSQLEALQAGPFNTLGSDRAGDLVQEPNMPPIQLSIQIRPADTNTANPNLVDVSVAACWNSFGRPMGEDNNPCNGVMDPGEDVNLNGWLDSPAMLSTRLARR